MEKMISTADGGTIFYEVIGEGQPLFFIHGNSSNHRYFKKQIDFFKNKYQLILMDTRDHGRSINRSDHLTFGQIMSDIRAILKNEKIEKVSFIGFSDGANIALTFSSYYRQLVDRIILVSPNITFDQLKFVSRTASRISYSFTKNILKLKKKARVIRLAMTDLPIFKYQFKDWDIPTLIVVGEYDIMEPQQIKEFASKLPNAFFTTVKNTPHSIPFLRPNQFNHLAQKFLNETSKDKQ